MSKPGEPRIRINPSENERAALREWLEIEEAEDASVIVRHVRLDNRRTHWMVRWEGELASEQPNPVRAELASYRLDKLKMKLLPSGCDFVSESLLLSRRDLCALADWVAFQLWKPEDDEAEEHETIPATDEPQSLGDA